MKKTIIALFTSLVFICSFKLAFAANLLDVYYQAFNGDPTFQATKSQYRSDIETFPQSIAVLLPDISGAATGQGNVLRRRRTASSNAALGTSHYSSEEYSLSASQSIFDFAKWMAVSRARATVKKALATLDAAEQNLMIRTATAYFNVLQAQDILKFSLAEKRAFRRQLDQAQQKYKVGLSPITDVYNAKANYDSSVATVIANRNNIQNSLESLRAITGVYYKNLAPLRGQLPLVKPVPANVEVWVDIASKQNFSLQAARFAVAEAKAQIGIERAGHFPILEATANARRDRNGDNGIGKADTEQANVGLKLSLPIFQGGLIMANTRQAQANFQTTQADMESTFRNIVNDTRQNYNDVVSGISQVKADRQAIISSRASLKSNEESFKVGTRTIIDVLNAQQQLTQTQQQHSQDQYAYILDTLTLKQAAGTLSVDDLKGVNNWLRTNKTKIKHVVQPKSPTKKPKARNKNKKQTAKVSPAHKAKIGKSKTAIKHAQISQVPPIQLAQQQLILKSPF